MGKESFHMNREELINFFNKYNIVELEIFSSIFQYVYDYEMTDVLESARIVYKDKYVKCYPRFESILRNMSLRLSDIKNKNSLLTDKELRFMDSLTYDALICLSSMQHFNTEYEVKELTVLNDSINDTIEKKKDLKDKQLKKTNTKYQTRTNITLA